MIWFLRLLKSLGAFFLKCQMFNLQVLKICLDIILIIFFKKTYSKFEGKELRIIFFNLVS